MLVRSALLASLSLAPISLPPMPRAASTTKYHFDLKTETTVDLSVVGAPTQITNLGLSAWVAMTLTDSAGGRVVHVVVDSLKVDTTIPRSPRRQPTAPKGAWSMGLSIPAATSRTSPQRRPGT